MNPSALCLSLLCLVLAACSGGGRSLDLTPAEIAELQKFGTGDCQAVVTNFTGRRIEAFYQIGLEESKVRSAMEIWPRMGYLDVSQSVLLSAPCEERQVVVGWRTDVGQAVPFADEVVVRETVRAGQTIGINLRRPSQASCSTDNAVNSIRSRCIIG